MDYLGSSAQGQIVLGCRDSCDALGKHISFQEREGN